MAWLAALIVVALLATPAAVADNPVVTVPGGITAEATSSAGADVSWPAVTASDLEDGTIIADCNPSSGSTFSLGDTTVTCTAKDTLGFSGSGSFTVTVQDSTPPTVTPPSAPAPVEATGPSGAAVSYGSASATDIVDGSVAASCSPASGSTFALGTTSVTCSATDSHGNTGSASFGVTVQDTTPPSLSVPDPITTEATGPAGADVSFSATGSDLVDGTVAASCSPGSGSTFPVGTTTVSCTAADSHGNSSAAKTFTVTVNDTTPPVVSVPAPITAEATGPSGAAVTFSASASDSVDGAITASCTPTSGSTFAIGTTTVSCHATDGHGNTGNASFPITVQDTTPPALGGVPGGGEVEADGPAGSYFSYALPSAVDLVDGPVRVTCSPGSGHLFPLGVTTVDCVASDSRGNKGHGSFAVSVVDTTAPALNVPRQISVSTHGADNIASSDPQVAAFLSAASARDLVDGVVPVTNDAPAQLPLGQTVITFTAADRSGNTARAQSSLTVVTGSVPPQNIDKTPPHEVTHVQAKAGDRVVNLSWTPPAADFDHVTITRTPGSAVQKEIVVYRGAARHFKDRRLVDGTQYRYVVIAWDAAGNRSAGIAVRATPKAALLLLPADGAVVNYVPVLRWVPADGATYYNVQLFRLGTKTISASAGQPGTKVLSAWPKRARLGLAKTWKYGGRTQRLAPGRYVWFVWPGFGSRSANRYGGLLGQSQFVYRPKR